MGNDGGSIPTRRELVKEAARSLNTTQAKEVQREYLEHSWSNCPLSNKKLLSPIVSDAIGNLYNKDAILQYLLPNEDDELTSSPVDCEAILRGRVKSLRDVVELKFEVEDSSNEKRTGKWICPVTNKELGPTVKAAYLVPCGHVFSDEAIREMNFDKCLQCQEACQLKDVIPILPTLESDKERLKLRLQDLTARGLTHSLKKLPGSKKKRKQKELAEPATAKTSSDDTPLNGKSKKDTLSSSVPTGIKNAATASLTARVLGDQEERTKRQKVAGNSESVKSLFTSNSGNQKGKNADFMTRGFSMR